MPTTTDRWKPKPILRLPQQLIAYTVARDWFTEIGTTTDPAILALEVAEGRATIPEIENGEVTL